MKLFPRLFVLFSISFFIFSFAFGQQKDWTGSVSDYWNEPLNWIPAGIPTVNDSVFTFYGEDLIIPSGFVAKAKFARFLHDVDNYGTLEINGGKVEVFWNFYNYGTIEITNSTALIALEIDPIQSLPMEFHNYGKVLIDGATGDAILQSTFNTFINHQSGIVSLSNYSGRGFKVKSVKNSGKIRMEDSGLAGFSLNVAVDSLWNQACGRIINFAKWEVLEGLVLNDGVIRHTSVHTDVFVNNLDNNGILEDYEQDFGNANINNFGFWIKPYYFALYEGRPAKILTVSGSQGHTSTGLYNDKNLTSFAGSYDNATHLWTPNANAIGDTLLYMPFTDTGSGCIDTLRFKALIPAVSVNYWVGNTGSWMNANNWSYGTVPTSTDKTAIYNSNAEVFIPNNQHIAVQDLYLKGDFLVRQSSSLTINDNTLSNYSSMQCDSCTIINNGLMHVNKTSGGLNISRGKLVNNNMINCDSTTVGISYSGNSTDTSTYIKNYGTIVGTSGPIISGSLLTFYNYGNILLTDIKNDGITSTHFINSGNVEISGLGTNEGHAIVDNLTNEPSGSIKINSIQYGLYSAELNNLGSITIDSCYVGIHAPDISLNEANGTIEINQADFGFSISDVFTNQLGASIIVKNSDVGIKISAASFGSSSKLVNEGFCSLDSLQTAGFQLAGHLYNEGNGNIIINHSEGDGIQSLTNGNGIHNEDNATMAIKNCAGNGIYLEGGIFDTKIGTIISIDSVGLTGLSLNSFSATQISYVTNRGLIKLGSEINGIGLYSDNYSILINYHCSGTIISEASFSFAGFFTNYGVYRQLSPSSILIYPNFINYGVIFDPHSVFQSPNIANTGIQIFEKSGVYQEGEVINDVMLDESSGSLPFTFSANWSLDKQFNNQAGSYDQLTNTLTLLPASIDSTRFYFTSFHNSCNTIIDTFFLDFENPIEQSCGNISWIGGKGQWYNPARWDKNRIPNSCDTVLIPQLLDTVTLNNAAIVQLNRLRNYGNLMVSAQSELQLLNSTGVGLRNENNIVNLGIIKIIAATGNGYEGMDNSIFDNKGELQVLQSGNHGIWMKNAIFYNKIGAQTLISNSGGNNLRLTQISEFYQKGIFDSQ